VNGRILRTLVPVAAMVVAVGACGSDRPGSGAAELVDGGASLVVANSPGTLTTSGAQRLLVAVLGDGPNRFLGGDDQPATFELRSVGGSASGTVEGRWLSPATTDLGLYVTRFEFAEPGVWEVTIEGGGTASARFDVATESSVPGPGDPAPPSLTPTATTAGELAGVTTDPEPVEQLYRLSIADAVGNGRPTVIAFATPAFCQTALCGPSLEVVKAAVAGHPGIDFVHVEPFVIEAARTGTLEPVPAMAEWSLATEPWVFVVDSGGAVAASFEGVIGDDELEAALAAL
jgi:hypothetical protein